MSDLATAKLTDQAWIYVTGPIDYWTGWTKLVYTKGMNPDLVSLVKRAGKELVNHAGWDGKARVKGTWFMSGLPMPSGCESALILAIKQDNNGTCYFVSQVPLAYMEGDDSVRTFRIPFKWGGYVVEGPV